MTDERTRLQIPLTMLGTANYPLRASSLPQLTCSLKFFLMILREDEVGPAAQTGTLMHLGIEEWMKGSSLVAAREAMDRKAATFQADGQAPGDCDEAARWVDGVAGDPNVARLNEAPAEGSPFGIVRHLEQRIAIIIPPAPFDPTGQDVHVYGTLDYLTELDGQFNVWDAKSSRLREGQLPQGLMHRYLRQLAVYAYGAEQWLGKPVGVGGLLWPRGYTAKLKTRKMPLIECPLSIIDIPLLIEGIAEEVAMLRSGRISANPGDQCQVCFMASGPEACLPQLRAFTS